MTRRSDIVRNLQVVLAYIDPTHTNAPVGTRAFLTTLSAAGVETETQEPDQTTGPERPYIGFRDIGQTPGPKMTLESRDEIFFEIRGYPNLRLSKDDLRTQVDAMMADVKAAINRDIRLGRPGIADDQVCTFAQVERIDTSDGTLEDLGYFRCRLRVVYHHPIGEE